ncbi:MULTISPECIES: hypothetical protein [Halorussus]|uniref:hypothetical protein n=1 Tax=Halorussus TaxID=1070314 RepID=UPI00209DAE43|nr:hypothetical protein [Halorussus vallis]USZ77539.1 hypothetical protein NGM07_09425 [Halorussus vallis]
MDWADLFERADAADADVESVREALAARRERLASESPAGESAVNESGESEDA